MTMKPIAAVEYAYDGDVHHDHSPATLAQLLLQPGDRVRYRLGREPRDRYQQP